MNSLRVFCFWVCLLVGAGTPSLAQLNCPSNINFELGNFQGWNCFTSTNTGTGNYSWTARTPINNRHTLTSSQTATDPYGGFPIVAPGGGNYSLKLGNSSSGSQMEQVRYTFVVPTGQNEYAVIYRYAIVLENPGHVPIQQPFFKVKAYNAVTQATVNCGNFDYISSSSLPGFFYAGSSVYCKDWATASLNLSGQAGNTITLEFTTSDCSPNAHFGYAYVDMNCGLFAIQNTACNSSAIAPLSAPPGFQSYTWYDSSFSQVIATGQAITVPNPTQRTVYRVKLVPYPGYGCTDTLSSVVIPAVLNTNAGQDTALCNIPSVPLSATVNGNAPPFTYAWSASSGTSSLSCLNCSNPIVTPTTETQYYLTVTDDNNCTATDTVSVLPTASMVANVIPVSCFGGNDGSIAVALQNGTAPLAYVWNTAQSTTSISSLAAGNYTLTITDGKGCISTPAVVVPQPATPLAASITQTNVSCNGGNNGTATVTVSGGTAPYRYSWSNGQTSATASGLSIGNYMVTVTDNNNCVQTATVNITQPAAALALTATQTASFCSGVDNGTATVTATGGTSPYSYSWNATPVQTTATAINLAGGTYTATVTDSNNCVDTISATITQIAALNLSLIPSAVSCNGGTNGTATVTATGGTTPYAYNWSNGQTTAMASGLSAGSYTVNVTDSNGCIDSQAVSITEPAALQLSSVQTDVLCYGDNNGSATVTATGGTAPYAYNWNTLPATTTALASGLLAGSYVASVIDGNDCKDTLFVAINQPAVLSLSVTQTDVSCNGGNNGTATVNAIGGASPYTYSWSNGQTGATATSLTAGSYTVNITDANNCQKTDSVTITQPAVLSLSLAQRDISCNGGSDGTIIATAAGGTTPYAYTWSNGQTTDTAIGLSAGTYTVTITDSNGCMQTTTATLTEPAALTVMTTQTDVFCNGGNNGTATVTATGGTAPYTYSWNNGQTTATASNLTAGTYTITVTDTNSCTQMTTVNITEPMLLSLSTTQTDVSCNGGTNGTVTVSAVGGTAPYTYSWSNGQTGTNATSLTAGSYTATITDAQGCIQTTTANLTEPAALKATTTQTDVSCNGGNNGTVTVNTTGGTTPYSYVWSNGQTGATASGLIAGTYTATVTDANGCTQTATAMLTEPAALAASATGTDISCNGGNNGTATVTASGGTAPYAYSWSDGQTTTTATGLTAGSYTVTVTDSNGCTQTTTAILAEPTSLIATVIPTNVSCQGGSNGTATVTASGGTAPYSYSWNTTPAQTTTTAGNLTAGAYNVTINDANGCTQTATATITEPAVLVAVSAQTDVSCHGGSDGTATVTASGGTTPYTYSWNIIPAQITSGISGLDTGTYIATVTDANGCIQTATATVTEPAVLIVITTQTNVSCNGGSNGTTTVIASGGTAPYSYVWSNGQTNATASGLIAGIYTATITDANGCTQTATDTLTEPTALMASITKVDVSCNGGTNGTATVTASGGTAPYTYSWSNGQTGTTATSLTAGSYTATVTDAKGCIQTAVVNITEPSALTASTTQTNIPCNGGTNGTAIVTASGGTAPYTYSWNTTPAQTTASISNLSTGSYVVTITDANSCTQTATATITEPAVLTASANGTNVSCNGGSNGTVTVIASGGTTPYTYAWNTTPIQTTATATNLTANSYTATVTDANGCTQAAAPTNISQPTLLTAIVSKTDASCNGGNNGMVTVTANGGSAPYTYSWNTTPAQTTATVGTLAAGPYTVTVTDANSCTQTVTTTIVQPTAIVLSATKTDVSCNGGTNGTATVTASGGTAPYTYSWNTTPAQTGATASNLSAGSYTATVTDANNCIQTAIVMIAQPAALSPTVSKTDVSCNGGNNGTATVIATGGTAPYSYSWNTTPTQTVASISGLPVGSYTATLTNANGCTQTATANITQPAVLAATISKTDASCNNSTDGTATVLASGGTAPYAYSWSTTPPQTTPTATTLPTGSYTVTVTDANGCVKAATTAVSAPSAIVPSIAHTNVLCAGGSTGTATVATSGGTAPYTYSWNTTPAQTTASISGLVAGSYTVTATDIKGCTQTAIALISEPLPLTASNSQTNPSCNGGNNGTATVTASGGTAPYSYSWNTTPAQTTASISGLSAGSYTATVTDANGCTKTTLVTITQPAGLFLTATGNNPKCYGNADGTVTVAVNGGTAPYTYSWNTIPAQTSAIATNLTIGSYTAAVTDANGCAATATAVLTQPDSLSLSMTSKDVKCFNGTDGSATVTATGGTAPYAYEWNGNAALNTASYNSFSAGTQVMRVTDVNGCAKTISAIIKSPPPVVAALVVDSIPCYGAATGVVRIASVSGGTGPYEYYWQGSSTPGPATFQNLRAGSYTVRVLDLPGCVNNFTITLPEHPSQNLNAGKDSLVCAGSNMTIQATGSAVQWQWTPATYLSCTNCANPIATPQQATTYVLTGMDAFGCVSIDSVTLTVQQRQPVSVGDSIQLCVGATATLSATGGDRYSWTPTTSLSCSDCPNPVVSDTVVNNYQVVVYQGNCFADTLHQQVVIAPNPTIQASSDVLLFSGTQITLQTTTSTNTKSVFWTPAVGLNCYNCRTPTVVDATTTTYVATAITQYGCTASDSIRVTVACDGSPFYVANTFTPNGDGRDDWFYPQGTGIVRINRMLIQSRWGETIFERSGFSSNNPEMGWNGTYRGQPMSSGTFMYLIEAICDSGEQLILKGDINLIR